MRPSTITRTLFKEVPRYVQSGNLSNDCADYLKYKCEGAIKILHRSSPICNILAKSIDQTEEVFSTVAGDFEENLTEETINCGSL